MKNGYATIIRSTKNHGSGPDDPSTSTAELNIHGALYLVGSEGYMGGLWDAPTQRNHHWGTLSTTDATKPSIAAKTSRSGDKTLKSDFSTRKHLA
ncbi:hypothetical protein AVEN_52474-1 [Araneus ventricosus]|uniref:Uncharacterized protein n=1 Tax=Araneus ventricosus TaxID=182803 RepID=A0A4Y2CX28_ARAVE|nr:hypothetical protein AVEN_52474-1 [Araneus ventricosus]